MNEIPKEWQLEPHYMPTLLWFSRKPQTRVVLGKEITSEESKSYPGWYFVQRGDRMRMVDSLEEALAELKSRIKHGNLGDLLGSPTPYQTSKSERKRMLAELLEAPIVTPPPNYGPDRDKPLTLLERKWELGEYLLVAFIEYACFRPEFHTYFNAANNPMRSLVGKVCTLQAATQADLEREDEDEDFEAEWKELSVGTVHLEGNRLTVGFWSHTFRADTLVFGVAFEEATFEDENMSYYLSTKVQR